MSFQGWPFCNIGVLWPNGWMDQDETWHGGLEVGLSPDHIVLDRDPASPKRGTATNFQSMSVVAKQLDGSRIKMPLGTEVGLGPGDILLDGDPTPPKRGTAAPPLLFSPCLLWPYGWMDQDATWYDKGRVSAVSWPGHIVLDGDSTPPKGAQPPPNLCTMSVVAKQLDGSRCHLVYGDRTQPR